MELLAPAGNLPTLKAVVLAGADAVYFGGTSFSARAYADNLSTEEAEEGIKYAHVYGKKAYLAVNTLLKNREIEGALYDFMKRYADAGIDAVIVQDMGVLSFLRAYFPDLPIHASTQMTVTLADGAAFLKRLGVARLVTARELSLDEIADIKKKTGIEIETFVHGALCMGYSGQCLMSSMIGGRSGNRGRCAQPCRLPYRLLEEDGTFAKMPGEYLLSLKDLCGIERIAQLAEAGVDSLKIEGRMKQSGYAAGVVRLYRKYLDAAEEGDALPLAEEDRRILLDLGSRQGFTDAYFSRRNGGDMMSYQSPSHEKKQTQQAAQEDEQKKIPVRMAFTAKIQEKIRLRVSSGGREAEVFGAAVEKAKKEPTSREGVEAKLRQTGQTAFFVEELLIDMDDGCFLPVSQIRELRRRAMDALWEAMAAQKEAGTILPFAPLIKKQRTGTKRPTDFFALCRTKEQFMICLNEDALTTVGLALEAVLEQAWAFSWEQAEEQLETSRRLAKAAGKRFCLAMPLILRKHTADLLEDGREWFRSLGDDVILCSNYDTLGFLDRLGVPSEKLLPDHRLYTFSERAMEAFFDMGYPSLCAPLELNRKELAHRDNGSSYLLLYGRIPLMLTANCQRKNSRGCDRVTSVCELVDRRGEKFPVKNVCLFCYNEIYNSRILQLFTEKREIEALGFGGFRLDFTLENGGETAQVLQRMRKTFLSAETDKEPDVSCCTFTKGHFHRGVE